MEINPRKVFERLFGQGGTLEQRLARQRGSAGPSVPCNPATAATAAPALATGDLLGLGDLSGSLETALLESALLEGFLEEPLEEIDD